MPVAKIPPDLMTEFALATPEEVSELERAVAALVRKRIQAETMITRIVAAGWSKPAAEWVVGEATKAGRPIKLSREELAGFAQYERSDLPPRPPWLTWVRLLGVICALFALSSLVSLFTLLRIWWRLEESRQIFVGFVERALPMLMLWTANGFVLLRIKPGVRKTLLKILNVVEFVDIAAGVYVVGALLAQEAATGRSPISTRMIPALILLLTIPATNLLRQWTGFSVRQIWSRDETPK